jgi:histidinol-phosphate aminotransferase
MLTGSTPDAMKRAVNKEIATRLERIIRPAVRAAQPYAVPDATGLIKLDAMENPYSLPASLRSELGTELSGIALNRYPDPGASALKASLYQALDIPARHAILPGNGSDELIQLIAMAVAGPDITLLAPEPGFAMYRLIAGMTGCRYVGVDLGADDFSLDRDGMLAAIDREQPAAIFIAWPNNPTGNLFDIDTVRAVIEAAPGLVVIDEAYHAFAGNSCLPLLDEYGHLLLLRTLSKLGLAGLRIGLMLGAPEWIEQFDKLRLPYNLGALNQAAACRILARTEVLAGQVEMIMAERERLLLAMQDQADVRVWPSSTNFLLFRVAAAEAVFDDLIKHGVLIRKMHGGHPLLHDCLRVTVGTPEENDRFLAALTACLRR